MTSRLPKPDIAVVWFHHPNRKRHLMATLPRWISTPIEDDQPDDTLADQDAHWRDEVR